MSATFIVSSKGTVTRTGIRIGHFDFKEVQNKKNNWFKKGK